MVVARSVFILSMFFWLTGCQTVAGPATACSPLGYDKDSLLSLKANDFRIEDAALRQRFAVELLVCLGDPDPQLRDGVAYEAYLTLLRNGQLEPETIERLRAQLLEQLSAANDGRGFRKPFTALALAEVARADRLEKVFSAAQRAELVAGATAYLSGITDYRGYDENDGWRHGVAHGADLMLQLVLNPAVASKQLVDISAALAAQVAPPGAHFYVYGEYERLARPVYFLAMRGELTEQQWAGWFAGLAAPAPFASWSDVWTSQAGLAKRHNTRVFALTLYTFASADDAEQLKPLVDGALSLLQAVP